MADQIRVLVVDDIPETRDHLTKLLGFESDIDVVGSAASGHEALEMAVRLSPDVILMDINMPDMDGIAATEQLSSIAPAAAVVMMSVQGEADYLRRSMLAGAREFLVKPFSSDELTASIRQVSARERDKQSRMAAVPVPVGMVAPPTGRVGGSGEPGVVVAVFSPKGGVGRTTVAVNLAVAAATELGKKVVIMDGSFQFGDVGVLLNLNPKSKSIADLIPEIDAGSLDSLDTFLINHTAGIRVLLAPPSPETAEMITAAGVKTVLDRLRADHDLVVVDCTSYFNDTTLAILDAADIILTMLSLEITSIKNMRLFLEVAEQLGYENGKVRLVLNRADSALGIRVADVEHSIGRKVDETIVSDGRSVVYALNRGVPFFLSNREAQVSQDILRLAKSVVGEQPRPPTTTVARQPRRSRCSHGDECRDSRPLGARRGVGDVPPEANRERPTGCAGAPSSAPPPPGGELPPSGAPPNVPTTGRLSSQAPVRESFRDVKFRIQSRVIQDLDPKLDLSNQVEVRRQIEEIFGKVIDEEGLALTRAERVRMLEQITDEIIGLGPLEPLLRDETVTEVMVNGPNQVYVERTGKLEVTDVVFQNDDHVMRIIDRIVAPLGRRIDESSPMVDARLPDGSRVNAIIPPLSLVGPCITIRKFSAIPLHRGRPDPVRHR